MTESRINARLDRATARKLALLKRRTGLTTSEIIRDALERLYQEVGAPGAAAAVLERSGFIGCAAGPEDLSASYERLQGETLKRKAP